MEKKYIVKLDDNKLAYTAIIIDGVPYIKPLQLLPYTEPDTSEVYQRGLSDAWEAARTLWNTPNRKEIFGHTTFNTVLTTHTAQEAIEKIRRYEQEQEEEQIQVWDEVKTFERKPFIVTGFGYGDDAVYCHGFVTENGISTSAKKDECVKTGRYFPEIAEVMQKAKR